MKITRMARWVWVTAEDEEKWRRKMRNGRQQNYKGDTGEAAQLVSLAAASCLHFTPAQEERTVGRTLHVSVLIWAFDNRQTMQSTARRACMCDFLWFRVSVRKAEHGADSFSFILPSAGGERGRVCSSIALWVWICSLSILLWLIAQSCVCQKQNLPINTDYVFCSCLYCNCIVLQLQTSIWGWWCLPSEEIQGLLQSKPISF